MLVGQKLEVANDKVRLLHGDGTSDPSGSVLASENAISISTWEIYNYTPQEN